MSEKGGFEKAGERSLSKLKFFLVAGVVIAVLTVLFFVFYPLIVNGSTNTGAYCDYRSGKGICLLSPRIYASILPAESFLIFNFKPLQQDIQKYIDENKLNVSVYVVNVRNSAFFGINSEATYEPASLNKLPIAMIVMKKIEKGELSLDTKLPILERDRDPDSAIYYLTNRTEMTVDELLYYMLTYSDNTALNVFDEIISLKSLQAMANYLSFYVQDVGDNPSSNSYKITTGSVSNLFMSLYISTVLTPEDSEKILSLLANSSFDIKKYAKIPEDVVAAQKYGTYFKDNIKQFHDCGLLYIKDSRFFYCIMTNNLEETPAAESIGVIVNKIYNYVLNGRNINNLEINNITL